MEAMMRNWESNESDMKGVTVVKVMKEERKYQEILQGVGGFNAQDTQTIHDCNFLIWTFHFYVGNIWTQSIVFFNVQWENKAET